MEKESRIKINYVHAYSILLVLATLVCCAFDTHLLSQCYADDEMKKHKIKYHECYDKAMNFWIISYGTIFLILVISLIISNSCLIHVLNKYTQTDSYKRVLKQMTLIFTISYGFRSIYLGVCFFELFSKQFINQVIQESAYVLWDFPPIISMLCLNLNMLKQTRKNH